MKDPQPDTVQEICDRDEEMVQVIEDDDARLLLLLDLGFQGVAEGLKPGAVGGESGLVLLLLSFNQGCVLGIPLEGLGFKVLSWSFLWRV